MSLAKSDEPVSRGAGVITSLAATHRRSDRFTVYLDGKPAFNLAADIVERAGLRAGQVLTERAQEDLLCRDRPYRARERALGLLAVRDRSRGEIEVRLKTDGFDPEVISDTVAWLQRLGYLDDERFVGHYVAEKLRSGWGPQRIQAELLRKRVERRVVERALTSDSGVTLEEQGIEMVAALARRRFGRQFREDPVAAGRKLAGFMARRGYDWESITAVTRLLTTEGESVESEQEDKRGNEDFSG